MPIKKQLLRFRDYPAWLTLLGVLLITSCKEAEPPATHTTLSSIRAQGELHVITRNTPSTYFQDKNGETGFEYELVSLFAKQLGVDLKATTADNIEDLFLRLQDDSSAALLAAGLSYSPSREQQAAFSNGYLEVVPQVIYNSKNNRPRQAEDLVGQRIMVVKDSIHQERLQEMAQQFPELTFEVSEQVETVDLLRMVDEGLIDVTLINSNELAMNHVYFPNIQLAFSVQPAVELRWALNHAGTLHDDSLLQAVNQFLAQLEESGTIAQLNERYFGHMDTMGFVGVNSFAKHLQQRLPRYKAAMERSAERYGLDWRLLAATAYQESHWDPQARSPTGVRGIMMLTHATAKEVKVVNRLDPLQSIRGGAQYLSQMLSRLPDSIEPADRLWFSLAAYNVGMGHLEDARVLTEKAGLNPNQWADVRKILPRLSEKKWYSQTRYGYARGGEPVQYVNNIRRYYDILTWVTQPQLEESSIGAHLAHTPGVEKESAD